MNLLPDVRCIFGCCFWLLSPCLADQDTTCPAAKTDRVSTQTGPLWLPLMSRPLYIDSHGRYCRSRSSTTGRNTKTHPPTHLCWERCTHTVIEKEEKGGGSFRVSDGHGKQLHRRSCPFRPKPATKQQVSNSNGQEVSGKAHPGYIARIARNVIRRQALPI